MEKFVIIALKRPVVSPYFMTLYMETAVLCTDGEVGEKKRERERVREKEKERERKRDRGKGREREKREREGEGKENVTGIFSVSPFYYFSARASTGRPSHWGGVCVCVCVYV